MILAPMKKNVDLSLTLQKQEVRGLDSEGVTNVIPPFLAVILLSFSKENNRNKDGE